MPMLIKKLLLLSFFSIVLTLVFENKAYANSKRIEVSLDNQKLYAFEDNKLEYDFLVSTGLPWWPTPKGTFYPWIKLRYDRMIGGSPEYGTYYDLPNVPWVVYFYNDSVPKSGGYSIHGTYWHNNFGTPMSHGCINLSIEDAQKIYNLLDFDTKIIVY